MPWPNNRTNSNVEARVVFINLLSTKLLIILIAPGLKILNYFRLY
jgi:hypothetical protein